MASLNHLLLLLLLAIIGSVSAQAPSAWVLDIYYDNGKVVKERGHLDTGCNTLTVTTPKVAAFNLQGNLFVDTVIFYTDSECSSGEYHRGTGPTDVFPDQQFKSYKAF